MTRPTIGKYCLLASFLLGTSMAQAQEVVYNTTDAGVVLNDSDVETLPQATMEPLNLADAANIVKPQVEEEEQDIYFSANEMQNDQHLQTITAIGDVNIVRDTLTVKADKIVYNQKDDVVTAVGNVVLLNEDGTVVFSDYVVLSDKMQEGEMENIKIIMKDKSQVAASKVTKYANDDKEMENAVYSPCDVCTGKDPLWQLKAKKIKHDAKNKNVYYENAVPAF